MRAVYKYWAAIVFLAVIVQIGFAGYGGFFVAKEVEDSTIDQSTFEDGWGFHAGFGYLVILAGLVLLVLALIARPGAGIRKWSGILFGLMVLQMLLAWFGFEAPLIGVLHPINALALAGISGWLAWVSWKGEPAAAAEPVPTTTAA